MSDLLERAEAVLKDVESRLTGVRTDIRLCVPPVSGHCAVRLPNGDRPKDKPTNAFMAGAVGLVAALVALIRQLVEAIKGRDTTIASLRKSEDILAHQRRVASAIARTTQAVPGYFENTVKSRLLDGTGSGYCTRNARFLVDMLLGAAWIPAEHPDVLQDCLAYKAVLPGLRTRNGVLGIDRLAPGTLVTVEDAKATGFLSAVVEIPPGEFDAEPVETWIILGVEQGAEVVFTFHPGEPVKPFLIATPEDLKACDTMPVELAKVRGFSTVKVRYVEPPVLVVTASPEAVTVSPETVTASPEAVTA